jgi:hypothetical protein
MWAADLAEDLAEGAEGFAWYLENSASRGDPQQRLTIAATEHEVARIAKQNASRLRDLSTTFARGQQMPKLPGTTPNREISTSTAKQLSLPD